MDITGEVAEHEFRQALGLDEFDDLPKPPPTMGACWMAHAPGYFNATAGSDDLHAALRLAADVALTGQCKAIIWDYRGDGADYDPAADPRPIAVVGVTWLDA